MTTFISERKSGCGSQAKPMSKMSSPRKFSEKIALHNQKQAEETAAFEQIMKEVSIVSRHPHSVSPHHHLQLSPALGTYRGGSLPNVNQLGNSSSIDLQQALHSLEDIKHATGRGVQDRVYRTQRPAAHRGRHEAAPYTAPYLSPPSDTSWRRTNSDSALHTSAMVPDVFSGPASVPPHRRETIDNMGDRLKPMHWDPKKGQQLQSRPRSCEVPGINICPSEQPSDSSSNPIPISSNTGSLPDLTNLHIPSPLPTPLDPEDQTYNHSGSATNLSQSMPAGGHLGVVGNHTLPQVTTHSPQVSPQMSPQAQRRQVMSNPGSPVVLNQRRHLSPSPQGIPLDQTPSIVVDHHQEQPNHHTQQQVAQQVAAQQVGQQQPQQQSQQQSQQQQQQVANQGNLFHQQQSPQQHQQQQQQQQHHHSNPASPQHSVPPSLTLDMSQMAVLQAQMQHYRDKGQMMGSNVSCSSPTSPVSNPNNSPLPSPGGSMPVGSCSPGTTSPVPASMGLFSDAYYQQQQTNALQYKFEQFNMMQNSEQKQRTTSTPTSPTFVLSQNEHDMQSGLGLSYGAVYSHNLGGSQELIHHGRPPPSYQQTLMQIPQHSHPSNIPDIIFTGAGESPPRQELAREISNAMASVDSNFEHDLLFSTDSLNVDPLDLEHLQMLSDNDIVADQATEDSFRQDHRL